MCTLDVSVSYTNRCTIKSSLIECTLKLSIYFIDHLLYTPINVKRKIISRIKRKTMPRMIMGDAIQYCFCSTFPQTRSSKLDALDTGTDANLTPLLWFPLPYWLSHLDFPCATAACYLSEQSTVSHQYNNVEKVFTHFNEWMNNNNKKLCY